MGEFLRSREETFLAMTISSSRLNHLHLSEETGFLKLTRPSLLVPNSAWNKSQTTGQISSI